jgi:CO dehydrogenase nickel-insertion accessory protein CooC1
MVSGRGKTGKTTLLRSVAEQSLEAGHAFLMADIDPTNASFAGYFEGVSRPHDDDPLWVCRATTKVRGRIASPGMLLEAEPLPHLICSRPVFIGGVWDEAGQHGDT